MQAETHKFQTEVEQLLQLMIHSLYSNKEIFLRELVSNASDALDKMRFEEITKQATHSTSREPGIFITCDTENKKLIIEDNGIGMTRDEVVANLGTIANSGTRKFLEKLNEQDKKDAGLIGQFGVGFYSAFMVAKKVTVESLSAFGGEAVRWESEGTGSYTLQPGTRSERGTIIEIELKEEEAEYASDWRVRTIIQKYSDYVTYPINLVTSEKTERLNKSTPVWARNKKENKPEDYNELYKQISRDFQDPALYEHISAEGLVPFQSVVFVPQEAPFDLYTRDNQYGLHLYVKRVSIMEKCKEVVPEYLRFISGVVETDDLPLNVSREILQQNTKLNVIRKQITKKTLQSLQNLAKNDNEKYLKFFSTFGPVLKEGFHFDREQHEALAELMRFRSTKTGNTAWVSFKEYTERMAENQKDIYFITGANFEAVSRSPHLEALTSRGIEVLFLTDPVDEWLVMSYAKHGEHALKSIVKGDIDLSGVGKEPEDNKAPEVPPEEIAPLLQRMRDRLGAEIKDVKLSKRLTESPCCLVSEENGLSSHMERILRATNKDFEAPKKILEVNPTHPLIKGLVGLESRNGAEAKLGDWIEILYDTALLAEGEQPKDPGLFAKKLTRLMEGSLPTQS